jgi:CubicO group peptidase (beta-lactamase class C family)
LDRGVGEKFEYSNLGVGLLGLALEGALGKEYQDLIRERITGPLGMEDTSEIFSRRMRAHLSEGHDGDLDRVPPSSWSHPHYSQPLRDCSLFDMKQVPLDWNLLSVGPWQQIAD